MGRGVISKHPAGKRRADQDMHDALTHVRAKGLVPWTWLVDETRALHDWNCAATVVAFLTGAVAWARIDRWGGQSAPLILCESRSFGGVLRRTLAGEYLCPVAATNGQVGGFLRTDVAPLLQGNARRVLYVGDRDDQGDLIEANTRSVLERETCRTIDWCRLALTVEQVADHDLPSIRKADNRYKPIRFCEAVEVESLGQATVITIVRDALDALLPEPLEDVLERERLERNASADRLAAWDNPGASTP